MCIRTLFNGRMPCEKGMPMETKGLYYCKYVLLLSPCHINDTTYIFPEKGEKELSKKG